MKKIKKCIAENWKDYIAIILMSISVVCVLLDIVQVFNISYFYSPYILVAPLSLAVVVKMFCIQEGRKRSVKELYYALGVASVEYLILLLLDEILFPLKLKVAIYMITAFYILIHSKIIDETTAIVAGDKDNQQEGEKKIFSLYYINTEKVYEIAMLLNNRIVTGGTSENQSESSIDKQTIMGISSNLNYLETVKGELGVSQNSQMHNGIKNKVLENFDVKTTKSNMLASIIAKLLVNLDYLFRSSYMSV